jgi:hypothetical protein
MDTLQKLFADESLAQPLRQKILDLIGDLSSSSLQREPVSTRCCTAMSDGMITYCWWLVAGWANSRGCRACVTCSQ